jgi:hypothetical protein
MAGLYRTHTINHKNSKDFLTINDPYIKKVEVMPRYRKKQFQTNPLKSGQTEGYFAKMKYVTDTYQDTKRYMQIEPLPTRKNGFGSRDAKRRDEFSSDVRTRQWREKLASEKCYTDLPAEEIAAIAAKPASDPIEEAKKRATTYYARYADKPQLFQTKVSFYKYDIGRTETTSTPICNKCSRDTFYCKHRLRRSSKNTLRRPGTCPTVYANYGSWDDSMPQADRPPTAGERYVAIKPKFGHVHATDSFFDSSHLT